MSDTVRVTVVYAQRDVQTVIALELPQGATVADAVARAGLPNRHPGGCPDGLGVGIWGREVGSATQLADGDRVELYRPLPEDPKETRRALARAGKSMGKRR